MQGSSHGLHKRTLAPGGVGDDVAVVNGQCDHALLDKLQRDAFCYVAVTPHEPEASAGSKGFGNRVVLGLNRLNQLLGLFISTRTSDTCWQ